MPKLTISRDLERRLLTTVLEFILAENDLTVEDFIQGLFHAQGEVRQGGVVVDPAPRYLEARDLIFDLLTGIEGSDVLKDD